jgi:hypothetical protein
MSNSGKEDLADAMLRDGPLNTTGADLRKALNAHTEYNLKLAFDTLETNKAAYNASLLQTSGMIAAWCCWCCSWVSPCSAPSAVACLPSSTPCSRSASRWTSPSALR